VHGVSAPPWLSGTIALGDTMTYPVYRLFISAACLLLALGMYLVFTRTRLGMMVRAGSTNREMVQSLGIDIQFLYRIVFAAGVAIAVLAGMVAAPVSSVYPGMGNTVLILCFVVVVIGGIGSIRGAFIAAILVGFVDTLGRAFFPDLLRLVLSPNAASTAAPALSSMLICLLMAIVLVVRPEGLFPAVRK
jgi:branched-chain amino acid transport system permease protein